MANNGLSPEQVQRLDSLNQQYTDGSIDRDTWKAGVAAVLASKA